MKYLFHLGHPAHFHLFKNTIFKLKEEGHEVAILIKKKDILEELLKESELEYYNLLPSGRRDSKFGIIVAVIETDIKMFRFALTFKPQILIGTSYAISHIGKLLNIPSLNVNEDDFDVVPLYGKLSYPWANTILAPQGCKTNKWEYKTVHYESFHELAYLHPNHFSPNAEIAQKYLNIKEPYFILRFAKLNAHHDKGIKGISTKVAENIISILDSFGRVYITSERPLETKFETYRIKINPIDIHHVLAFSTLYIGDSQTMAAEAGILGVPFIRFNDFADRINYLLELEHRYELGFSIGTSEEENLYNTIKKIINTPNLRQLWQEKRIEMLSEKIDYSKFLFWFIKNYPVSKTIMNQTPEYQFSFR